MVRRIAVKAGGRLTPTGNNLAGADQLVLDDEEAEEVLGLDRQWNHAHGPESARQEGVETLEKPTGVEKAGPPGPPPRPGLEWRDETHRWIRPGEESPVGVMTHTAGFGGADYFSLPELLDKISQEGLRVSLKRGAKTRQLDQKLGRPEAVYSFDFDTWTKGITAILSGNLSKAVFIIMTPTIQRETEVQDYDLAHKPGEPWKAAWDRAKRQYGEDISHINKAEYATLSDVPVSNLVFGRDLLKTEPGKDLFSPDEIIVAILKVGQERESQGLLKARYPIHVWQPDTVEDGNIKKEGPPGPPPRPGLEWRDETHRWVRPEDTAPDGRAQEGESTSFSGLRDYAAGKSSVHRLIGEDVELESPEVRAEMKRIKQSRFDKWEHATGGEDYEKTLTARGLPKALFEGFSGVTYGAEKFNTPMLDHATAVYEDGHVFVNPDQPTILLHPEEWIPGRSPIATAFHEFGHHIEHNLPSDQRAEWDELYTKLWRSKNHWDLDDGIYPGTPTYYAMGTMHEFFADVFMLSILDRDSQFFVQYPESAMLLKKHGLWGL